MFFYYYFYLFIYVCICPCTTPTIFFFFNSFRKNPSLSIAQKNKEKVSA